MDEVMERFMLTADLSESTAAKYKPLCADAMAEISRRSRSDDAAAQGILCAAAAALAFYRWALMNASSNTSDFSVGDVKVTKHNENAEMAKLAWREAAAAAAPYLEDTGFLFERTCK